MNESGPVQRAAQPKTTTLCTGWFFGGPHQWSPAGRCYGCRLSRAQVRVLAKFKVQPALACEAYGHRPAAGWTALPANRDPQPALHVVVDNVKKNTPRLGRLFTDLVERGTVDLDRPARCSGCGCTDSQGCPEGCYWLAVDRRVGSGVCNSCPEQVARWEAGGQERKTKGQP